MKTFLRFSVGVFLILVGVSLVIYSVHPAYGERENISSDGVQKTIYVNIDSINANYLAYAELSKSAGDSLQQTMEKYQRKAADLQDRYAKLQERVNMGTISTEAAEREEAAINLGLEELKMQEVTLAALEQRAMATNDSISANIALFFHDYSIAHHVDYVLMYGTGMPIIYANEEFDVTNEVLASLNAQYRADKSKH